MAEEITLEFIARQLERMLDRIGTIEDQITVLTGIAMRLDGSLEGLAIEVRDLINGYQELLTNSARQAAERPGGY